MADREERKGGAGWLHAYPAAGRMPAGPSGLALALSRFFQALKAAAPDEVLADRSIAHTLSRLKAALASQGSAFAPARRALTLLQDRNVEGGLLIGKHPADYRRAMRYRFFDNLSDEPSEDEAGGDVTAVVQLPPIGKATADILAKAAKLSATDNTVAKVVEVGLDELLQTDSARQAYAEAFGADAAAAFIRSARSAAGLTQAQLAARMGVNQSRIAELERGGGKQGVTTGLLARVALACDKQLMLSLK